MLLRFDENVKKKEKKEQEIFLNRTYADPTRPPLNQGRREDEDFSPLP